MKNKFSRTYKIFKELLRVMQWSKDQHNNIKNHFVLVDREPALTHFKDVFRAVFSTSCNRSVTARAQMNLHIWC